MDMNHYNGLVGREDDLCNQVETCQSVIQKILDYVYENGAAVHKQTVEKLLLTAYDIEHEFQVDLLLLRAEKYYCAACNRTRHNA